MKHLLLTTITAVLVVGCDESQQSPNTSQIKPSEVIDEEPIQRATPPQEPKPVEPIAETQKPKEPLEKTAENSIYTAAQEGNVEAVKIHLASGVELNQSDASHRTPLMRAAERGGKNGRQIVKLLLANGADVNATDDNVDLHWNGVKYGWTALHAAVFYHRKETVELLIANGADVNAKDMNGVVPLHKIFTMKFKEREPGTRTGHVVSIAKLLIDAGAEVNAVANNGKTPLDEAIESRHIDLQDLFWKHGGKRGEELTAEGK